MQVWDAAADAAADQNAAAAQEAAEYECGADIEWARDVKCTGSHEEFDQQALPLVRLWKGQVHV